jgi:hypothetical protein
MGNFGMTRKPASRMDRAMTQAKIGLSIKKRGSMIGYSFKLNIAC